MSPAAAPSSRVKRVLTFMAASLAALVATEGALRAFAPVHLTGIRAAYVYDPELGYRLKPGARMVESKDYQEEVRANALGTGNFEEDLGGYAQRVFALGDSYTQGIGVPADTTYPFELGLLLNLDAGGKHHRRYAVLNLALAAFGGEQSLLTLDRYRTRVGRPDVVLYLGSENDDDDDRLFLSGYRHGHLVDHNPRYGRWLGLLQWGSSTEIGKRGALIRARLSGGAGQGGAPERSVAERQRGVFERLVARCRETKSLLVVSWSVPGPSYDWLARWAAGAGVQFADWAPSVASVQASIPDLPMDNGHSGGHHRAWVNRLIAAAYAREIQRHEGDVAGVRP